MHEHDGLPGIAFLSACWRWFEELIVVLSAPMLLFGAGITVVDLLTDGSATLAVPWLLFAWAVSQAMGIEANVSGAVHKAKLAYERGAWFPMMLYVLLVCALGAVVIIAGYAYSYHQAQGIPIQDSLRDLGIDPAMWTMSRSILAFALIAISAAMRFTGKKESAQSKLQKLQEELQLEPVRQALRETKLAGGQRLIAQARGKAVPPGVPAPSTIPNAAAINGQLPPDLDPSNQANGVNVTPYGHAPWGADLAQESGPSIHLVPRQESSPEAPVRTPRKRTPPRKPRGAESWRDLAQAAWYEGKRTVSQLERAVVNAEGQHISHGAAQYWRAIFAAYEEGQSRARQEA